MLDLSGSGTLETSQNKQQLTSFISKCLGISKKEKSSSISAVPLKPA